MSKNIYLDNAAATPLDPKVFAKMQPYFTDKFYNPSAIYLKSKEVSADVSEARAKISQLIGCRPSEIVFTAGGTEANNLAIRGVMDLHQNAELLVSSIEHDSVINVADLFNAQKITVSENGQIDLDNLTSQINDNTVLVSIMYANNEIGTIQPIKNVSEAIKEIRKSRNNRGIKLPLWLHTDACQAGEYLDLNVARLGVDLMTLNGGKIYGPKQSGILFIRAGVKLAPQILGGGQERGLRSGTENVANIIGLSEALGRSQAHRVSESKRLLELQKKFISQLLELDPGAKINGSVKNRLPNNVSITFPGVDNERLIMELDERGIMAAVGSACSASSDEPSHVLKAIGLTDELAQSTVRFTLGRQTTAEQLDYTVEALGEVLSK